MRADRRSRPHLGQHFLRDPAVVARILEVLDPQPEDFILEVGSGRGALSVPLSNTPARLALVEIDHQLAARLRERLPGLQLYEADILEFDFAQLPCEAVRVVGNLPYQIGTEILFRLVRFHPCIQDVLVMLQKEVVQRIVAAPGTSARGRLSVMCQTWYEVQAVFDIPPGAFQPAPRVDSTLLWLGPDGHWRDEIRDTTHYARLVRTAFSKRRKTLRNALHPDCPARVMEELGISPDARAETLRVEDFVRLSNRLAGSQPP